MKLIDNKEGKFRADFNDYAKRMVMNVNPDDPRHKYDFRAYYAEHKKFPMDAGETLDEKFLKENLLRNQDNISKESPLKATNKLSDKVLEELKVKEPKSKIKRGK
tara:strand:- start:53 stop:367 length:315 start_codon:yes stop_codon:yes gene_type:complete